MIDYLKLREKIEKETINKEEAKNYADSLFNSPIELAQIIELYVSGQEPEFVCNMVPISLIREKENCSYLRALLQMQLLMTSPELATHYIE